MPSALKLHPKCPLGVDSASRLLPCVLVSLLSFCCEICWHFCPRFGEASLLTKETFEIPFLEKSVLPGRGAYSGFLAHGDSTLVGIQFGSRMEKPVGKEGEKGPVSS